MCELLAPAPPEVRTVFLEQLVGIRPKGPLTALRKAQFRCEIIKRLRAILARRDLLTHIKNTFPKMADYTADFGTWDWYAKNYGCQQDGTKDGKPFIVRDCTVPDEDRDGGDGDAGGSTALDTCGNIPAGGCSTFLCYSKLVGLCNQLMLNHHEVTLCKLSQSYVPGKSLNLGVQDAQSIKDAMTEIMTKYQLDFPPSVTSDSTTSAKTVHLKTDGDRLEVTTEEKIDTIEEYKAELARYNQAASAHETASLREFLDHRLVMIVDNLDGTAISSKLGRIGLLREKKRKLYVYDSTIDGPLDWTAIKKRGLSVWAGAGPGFCEQRLQAGCAQLDFLPGLGSGEGQAAT